MEKGGPCFPRRLTEHRAPRRGFQTCFAFSGTRKSTRKAQTPALQRGSSRVRLVHRHSCSVQKGSHWSHEGDNPTGDVLPSFFCSLLACGLLRRWRICASGTEFSKGQAQTCHSKPFPRGSQKAVLEQTLGAHPAQSLPWQEAGVGSALGAGPREGIALQRCLCKVAAVNTPLGSIYRHLYAMNCCRPQQPRH